MKGTKSGSPDLLPVAVESFLDTSSLHLCKYGCRPIVFESTPSASPVVRWLRGSTLLGRGPFNASQSWPVSTLLSFPEPPEEHPDQIPCVLLTSPLYSSTGACWSRFLKYFLLCQKELVIERAFHKKAVESWALKVKYHSNFYSTKTVNPADSDGSVM